MSAQQRMPETATALRHTVKQALSQILVQAWSEHSAKGTNTRGHFLVPFLLPISWLFTGAVAIRRVLYKCGFHKQQTLPVPVIVVGNVMVGGVGKTPITIALVNHLKEKGLRVGVLSRGFGRKTTNTLAVSPTSNPLNVGDEPVLIARSCKVPVFVSERRVDAGHALLKLHPDVQVLLCDDGLQHWPLARDLELCVFDERGVGNGRLLPAGPLRETWPRKALDPKVPCLVLNTAGNVSPNQFAVQRHLADYAIQADGSKRSLASWGNTPVQALAAIAKPEKFFSMLREKGLNVAHTEPLSDHAQLQAHNIDTTQGDLICTEKDAVKLWTNYPQAWAVPLQTTLPPELLSAIDLYIVTAQHAKLSSPHGH